MRLVRAWMRLYRESLRGLPRATWRLAITTLVQRACTMAIAFSTLYLHEQLGFSVVEAATMLALFGAGGVAGSLCGGVCTERFGALRLQVVSLVATAIGFFVYPIVETQAEVTCLLVALGFSTGAYRPAASTMLTATVPESMRAQAFAFYRLAINLGMAVGPAVGGLLAEIDFDLVFWVDGFGCLATAALTLAWLRNIALPTHADDAAAGQVDGPNAARRSPWRDGPMLLITCNTLVVAAVVMQWFYVGTIYFVAEYGMTKAQLGLVLAVNPVLIVLLEMAVVQKLRSRDAPRWIALASAFVALSSILVPLGSSIAWAVLALSLWTIGEMIESPLASAFVANRAGSRNMGRYMGLYTASWSVAAVLAPWLGGAIYAGLGGTALWIISAAVAGLSSLLLWTLRQRVASLQQSTTDETH